MAEVLHTKAELREMQAWPLEKKVDVTTARILEWSNYFDDRVCVSFSGGKDSTVLLDIARRVLPDIPAVFADTGLEYPEIREFAKSHDNVTFVRPRWGRDAGQYGHKEGDPLLFRDVLMHYGYPLISKNVAEAVNMCRRKYGGSRCLRLDGKFCRRDGKHSLYDFRKYKPLYRLPVRISDQCCVHIKERPIDRYCRESGVKQIIGTMAEESVRRTNGWLNTGCNAYSSRVAVSKPMSFWTSQDTLQYIRERNLPICSVYGQIVEGCDGLRCTECQRTGCIYCGFGVQQEKGETRFQRLKRTHPQLYSYCMEGGAGTQ